MEHDERARERFVREARIAANLHHQHIVPIHDVGVHEGIAYIAMEYEPGGTIGELAHEALEPGKALRIAARGRRGARLRAPAGVVHRDVKPGERAAPRRRAMPALGLRHLAGTRAADDRDAGRPQRRHAAVHEPEQLRGQELDGRSDLYSLGVMLYQLLTGTLPFEGADLWAIGTQHVSAPIPYLPEHLAHIQPLVDTLMAKEPDARPKSGAEWWRGSRPLLASSQRAALTPALTQPMVGPAAEQPSSFNKSHRVGLIAGLALALLALAVVLTQSRPWRASEPAAGSTTPAPAAPSIAVLPFVDMSQDKDQEYFSDGLSEELLDRLANIPQLKVAGRTSSFSFKGRGEDLKEIGSKLGRVACTGRQRAQVRRSLCA
jgi:serine/threonine protein kinase